LLLLCYLANASFQHLKVALHEEAGLAPTVDTAQADPALSLALCPVPPVCNPPQYCQYASPTYNALGCKIACGPLTCNCPVNMEFTCGTPDQCSPKCSLPAPYCPIYNCFNGCHCKYGMLLNSQGTCVLPQNCDVCPPGQYLDRCAQPSCGTCTNQDSQCAKNLAWFLCSSGCFCNGGLFRNHRGQCLTTTQCAHQCCDPWKEPGQLNNPVCFEGHKCCPTTGEWVCGSGVYNGVYTVDNCPGASTGPFGSPCVGDAINKPLLP